MALGWQGGLMRNELVGLGIFTALSISLNIEHLSY
jgi:hypothetical protein